MIINELLEELACERRVLDRQRLVLEAIETQMQLTTSRCQTIQRGILAHNLKEKANGHAHD